MRVLLLLLSILAVFWPAMAFAEEDHIQCTETQGRILCNLRLPDFIKNTRELLTNGWENTLTIEIALMNGSKSTVLRRSRLEATQRCYLDPFESPCLLLWSGAASWQKYRDAQTFLKAMSHFGVQAMTLTDLPADNYIIRISISIMPSAVKRLRSIRSWFQQNGSENGLIFSGNALIGSILGSRIEQAEGDEGFSKTLETTQFYIDLSFKAPEAPAPETP